MDKFLYGKAVCNLLVNHFIDGAAFFTKVNHWFNSTPHTSHMLEGAANGLDLKSKVLKAYSIGVHEFALMGTTHITTSYSC